jgi:hypothetical protein
MNRKLFVAVSVLMLAFALILATSMPAVTQSGPYNYVTLGVRSAFTVLGKAIVGDSLRVQGAFKVNGNTTLTGTIISATTSIAKIDSFLTTAVVDTTKMTGASVNDVFVVSQYTPAYSATLDTFCVYSARYFSGDSVIVKRAFSSALPHIVKSAGIFCIVKIDK